MRTFMHLLSLVFADEQAGENSMRNRKKFKTRKSQKRMRENLIEASNRLPLMCTRIVCC